MDYSKVSQAYKKTEEHSVHEIEDPHAIVETMLVELVKSMTIFADNIDLKTGNLELKSKHFSRSLTIIYGLQTSIDFEKGGDIANGLFQIYEYARQQLLSDMGKAKPETTPTAIHALEDIIDAWKQIEPTK